MQTSTWYLIKQRLAWIKMHERGAPVAEVCRYYGISRKTFYKWLRRYQKGGRDFHALRDRSRRPRSHPRAIPKPVADHVVALRRKSRYGPRRLAFYLQAQGINISVYGIYRVLQRAGLVKKRRSRPRKKPQSYAMLYPGQRGSRRTSTPPSMTAPASKWLGSAPNSPLRPACSSSIASFAPSLSPSRRSRQTMEWSSPMSFSPTCRSPTPLRKPCAPWGSATSSSQWPCPSKTAR